MAFPSGTVVKNLPAVQEIQETQVQSLGQEDPIKQVVSTHREQGVTLGPHVQLQE